MSAIQDIRNEPSEFGRTTDELAILELADRLDAIERRLNATTPDPLPAALAKENPATAADAEREGPGCYTLDPEMLMRGWKVWKEAQESENPQGVIAAFAIEYSRRLREELAALRERCKVLDEYRVKHDDIMKCNGTDPRHTYRPGDRVLILTPEGAKP